MTLAKRVAVFGALVTFLVAAAVYLFTLTPTVPFWDSGEFIAVSNILGIPHPPGTPFFVMLGRCATLIPIASIAQRVNGLSAIASALAVLLTFLCTLRLIRLAMGPERTTRQEMLALIGAAIGALMLAFSDNFWENAVEAEVYSEMSLAQILVLWLALKWWEGHEKRPSVGPLLVAVYVMWVSVGLCLAVGMMGLPLLVLAWLVDRRVAMLFAMPFVSVLLVTFGLERMVGGVLFFSICLFIYFAIKGKLPGWLVALSAIGCIYGMYVAFSDLNFEPRSSLIAALSVAVPLGLLARRTREGRILALILLLMVAGYSTHAYLPIRAAQHPAINEGNPSNWESLRDLLERKQYGQMNMFVRRSSWASQIDKEFWRYFQRQWPLFPSPRPWAGAMVPLLLGLGGMWWHGRREKIGFLTSMSMFSFSTVGMIIFLNFTDHEVRDRDYFYTSGFHWYCIWIGMGVVCLVEWVRESFPEAQQKLASVATALLLLALPALLCRTLWFTHDRSGNFVAHDYAYNMLEPLAPNAFVFTNGDNDTFPLWYIQQVENLRKDVRVVNLSLLNTDWYITQLRDEDPKVPISLDDRTIKMLGGGAIQDPTTGQVVYTNDYMVAHIMQEDRKPGGGWKKPPYFAVTVPEHMGLDKYFTLEGLVYRVNTDTLQKAVDEDLTRKNLYEVFRYRGLFNPDGSWNTKVYKDENASTLSRNYAAAHLQLAFLDRRRGELQHGIQEMERIARMFPDYTEVLLPLGGFYMEAGDTAKAAALFDRLAKTAPQNSDVRYYHGAMLLTRGDPMGAMHEFDTAIQLDPNNGQAYYAAYMMLWERGQREQGLGYLQRWLDAHPGDPNAQQLLEASRKQLGSAPESARAPRPGALPKPPMPNLP